MESKGHQKVAPDLTSVGTSPPSLPPRVCLLECSVREVRVVVASVLEKTLESALHFGDLGVDDLTDTLLSLLDKDVPENVKNCAQYFGLFSSFAQQVRNRGGTWSGGWGFCGGRGLSVCFCAQGCGSCQLLLKHSAYRRMLVFLLGPNRQNNQVPSGRCVYNKEQSRIQPFYRIRFGA